jgi:ATP-binding protein involved in chromosome partitioning
MINQDSVVAALKSVKYPGYSRDIVSFGLVKQVDVSGQSVKVLIELSSANPTVARQIQAESERALREMPGAGGVAVEVRQPSAGGQHHPSQDPWASQSRVPGVRRIIAVASGKGGVGKSTVAVNLACAMAQLGDRVGLVDCDIYGPTIPLMMGIRQLPPINDAEKWVPPAAFGVKLMSIGLLVDGDQPVIWRGPLIAKTIQQFLFAVEWGDLDWLLVDLPPGTGDAQLSLCQTVPLDGGVMVTTPQEAAVAVVRKGMAMFEHVNVPILGLIENMSYFLSPSNEKIDIFGHGGGRAEAERRSIPFLGEIPISPDVRMGGDKGMPIVVSAPKSLGGQAFLQIADALRNRLASSPAQPESRSQHRRP